MPLTMARAGETTCIRKINGKDEAKRHLENLGFIVGEAVTVISEIGGNLILSVRGTRIALDRAMAMRIII